jgi:hypothetical protein
MPNSKNIRTLLETLDSINEADPGYNEDGSRKTGFSLARAQDELAQIQAQIAALQEKAQKIQSVIPSDTTGMAGSGDVNKSLEEIMAERRAIMKKAWETGDASLITNADDRESLGLPPLAQSVDGKTPQKHMHDGPRDPVMDGPPPDIAGEKPDLWAYANRKNKEQYEKELKAREEAEAKGLIPEPWSHAARRGMPDAPDLFKWAKRKEAEKAAQPKPEPKKGLWGKPMNPETGADARNK